MTMQVDKARLDEMLSVLPKSNATYYPSMNAIGCTAGNLRSILTELLELRSLRSTEGKEEVTREQMDDWREANCGSGLPYDEATDEAGMLHGLAYVLRQIESSSTYRPHIGQCTPATSALRMALDHFARAALTRSPE